MFISGNVVASTIGKVLSDVLRRPDVPVQDKDVPVVVKKVEEEIGFLVNEGVRNGDIVAVQTKSPFKSVINWLNGVFGATVLGYFGLVSWPVTPEEWIAAVTGVAIPWITVILRTWFTPKVTPQSVK